jgi:hypothetical protein
MNYILARRQYKWSILEQSKSKGSKASRLLKIFGSELEQTREHVLHRGSTPFSVLAVSS